MTVQLLLGDCLETLKTLPDGCVQTCVTSPPYYGLRDYGVEGQIGLEETPEAYVAKLVAVFREVRRVLKDDGTLWLNLGDSYAGSNNGSNDHREDGASLSKNDNKYGAHKPGLAGLKPKDLIGIPWMVAFALRADGWWLRQDIIWAKPNPMPESVTDRCTKSHEYIFMFSKSAQYFYDYESILEPANFDGRKDTRFKGAVKNYEFADPNGGINTISRVGGEQWPRKMSGIGPKHGQERDRGEEYKPIRGYKTKDQLPDMQHHGKDIYSRTGTNIVGHSGNYNADGEPNMQTDKDGVPARNKRDVWTVTTKPYRKAHFATYPPDLIEPCILAGSRPGDTVLDPFNGSGTTGAVSLKHHRNYIGCELNPAYIELTNKRLEEQPVLLM
jgi:site-specific DNA-methyltransferase (adenine-specific)